MPAAQVTARDRERFARARARGDARAQDPSTIVEARYDAARDAIELGFRSGGVMITQPTVVLNGVDDLMIATVNSFHPVQNIPNAQLIIYAAAGHGAQYQYPQRFLRHATQFLDE
jgi:pimeloyl-ACP methyl ester carboxylesterase